MPYKVIGGKATHVKYSSDEVFSRIKHEGIKFIDLQFTSLPGRFHHTTISADTFTPEQMEDGLPKLDGSSIVGFTSIHDSDLILKPDPSTFAVVPWIDDKKTARLLCDVYWGGGRGRLENDPRGICQKAEEYVTTQGFDHSTWGPEVEFFVFDKVNWDVLTPYKGQSYSIDSVEAPWSQEGTGYPMGLQEGYYPSTPSDTLTPFRNECVDILNNSFGILCDNHHHEVATAGQGEIDIVYNTLLDTADNVMAYKYVVKNVAKRHGKVATFMPKPIFEYNGTGMHTHQSIWKDGKPLFAGNEYGGFSKLGLNYTGGLIKHGKALMALAAPTTNSYKRLTPGFEAPTILALSARNRSAACRVPMYFQNPAAKRIEFRSADPTCNPYLTFSAMLLAGLDGIENGYDPGEPLENDLFELPLEEQAKLPQVPSSLEEALNALEEDHDFLLKGGVFTEDVIKAWIDFKRENDVDPIRLRPHPYEFFLSFDA